MAIFMVRTPSGDLYRFPLDKSSIRIGRGQENDLNLNDPTVSRQHARIERRADGVYVSDRGSRSGTMVNGSVAEGEVLIQPGDRISLGSCELTFGALPSTTLEMDDTPLPSTAQTTVLPVEDVTSHLRTPVPEAPDDPALLSLILEADRELALHRPVEEMYQRLLDLATKVAPCENGALLTIQPDAWEVQAHRSSATSAGSVRICQSLAKRAVRSKEALLVHDATADPRHVDSVSGATGHSRSVICAPLWNDQGTTGLLYVDDPRPRAFKERHLNFLTHLAYIAAVKLENKRLFDEAVTARALQEELRKAAEIQHDFLPKAEPEIPGYRLHGTTRPCFAVGGDFYQYFDFGEGRYGVALGDVAGKGLSAALLMCSFQTILSLTVDGVTSPGDTVGQLNRNLCERVSTNRFITFFFGVLDTKQHVLHYVNAGQNYPLLLRPGRMSQKLHPGGLPLGIDARAPYVEDTVPMEPDSVLFTYSDGITELRNPANEEFGLDRLQNLVSRLALYEPRQVVTGIMDAGDEYGEDQAHEDDITLMVLQRASRGA
jgi:serine phosphatase RsbU (regulator of sigma subunit)/pSer/pThr/pTyr-binding forkhead associated (FHA) protein